MSDSIDPELQCISRPLCSQSRQVCCHTDPEWLRDSPWYNLCPPSPQESALGLADTRQAHCRCPSNLLHVLGGWGVYTISLVLPGRLGSISVTAGTSCKAIWCSPEVCGEACLGDCLGDCREDCLGDSLSLVDKYVSSRFNLSRGLTI